MRSGTDQQAHREALVAEVALGLRWRRRCRSGAEVALGQWRRTSRLAGGAAEVAWRGTQWRRWCGTGGAAGGLRRWRLASGAVA
ncbi:hypothetical protein GCM10017788_35720 [Amycolatopsis acidiphila]|nr:hypothetical protein GCM10017788_35720 [Amycolatopsis acidiphila]